MAAAIPTVSSFSITSPYSFNSTSPSSPATASTLPRAFFLSRFVAPHWKPSLMMSTFRRRHDFSVFCQQQQQLPAIPSEQRWMFEDSEINGPDIWNKTWYPKAADHISTKKTWYIVDATDKILGRMASAIAVHIRGKNLATYTPSVDMGAYVIVVNAEKVAVSGKKRTQKLYRRHSGRPGGLKVETFDQLQNRIPERIIEHAVRGMLPKGRLGRTLFTHLKVYEGPSHPHEAQQPIPLPIRDKRMQLEK
ncbi:50S ribosomal protein L13, chloroplastic [Phalaenopsis equestris]|uniref:50S ribosomal protein L13, chloroplastic n=1 Tax=Phalaenopsis equestris TaxID=78828 RepID=UPI0009E20666|nr:50S ribosomal protein L13, chloroplastic [Phalaenopsis equestris]